MNHSNPTIITHLTPHLGGGVGTVLLNYLDRVKSDSRFNHQVLCLDSANIKARIKAKQSGFSLRSGLALKHQEIRSAVAATDILLIHWWNHPLLFDFLVRSSLPRSRVVIWSHISGSHPPSVFTNNILSYPDLFVFTTPLSLQDPIVCQLPNRIKYKNLRVIWSTGGVEQLASLNSKSHKGFNIGYVGTVDYAKLHPSFLQLCQQIDIPNVKFIVCGGPADKQLKAEAERLNLTDKFDFVGPVKDVAVFLAQFDVFGYPLTPYHYGTCDQSLQEAMAAGVVPVVFDNQMEKHMVKDRLTGLVVKNNHEYVAAVRMLYQDPVWRKRLSVKTKQYATENFSLDKMIQSWNKIFEEILLRPKTDKRWPKTNSTTKPNEVFLESLGVAGRDFIRFLQAKTKLEKESAINGILELNQSDAWRTETKGTVHHYYSFFPYDSQLAFWSQLMKNDLIKNK